MSDTKMNFMGTPLVDTGPGVSILDIGLTWTFTSIATVFVALRYYLRAKFSHLFIDDHLMLAALVLLIASSACATKANLHGLGREFESLTLDDFKISNYWFFLFGPLNVFISLFARTSIAILLVRIFGVSKPRFRQFVVGWTAFLVIGGILSLILYLARLTPIQAQWDPTIPYRVNYNALVEEYVALGAEYQLIISDITYVFFPVMFIWTLNMPWHKKIGLLAMMSVGLITAAAGIARVVVATEIVRSTFYATQNAGVIIGLMATIENSLSIALGCVPALGNMKMLQFKFITRIAESLASLLTRHPSASKQSSKESFHPDVEHGHHKHNVSDDGTIPLTGVKGGHTGFIVANHPDGHAKTTSSSNIVRTDRYLVSFDSLEQER